MTTYSTNVHATPSRSRSGQSIWQWLATVIAVRRQRKQLSDLEPHLLRDIGLSQEAADAEASRKLWDVPEHWLR